MEKGHVRSQSYQAIFNEIYCSHEILSSFCNEDSISARLNPYEYNEDLIELEAQLKIEFWRIVNTKLTKRQKEVIKLYADGYTQMEIAKTLGVNQSSITKSIFGNTSYDIINKGPKKTYGGSRKKMQKIIENDERIKEILLKMEQI